MKPKTKQVLFPFLALTLFSAIAFVFMANKKEQEKKPPKKNDAFVTTRLVEVKPYHFQIESQGLVTPRYDTTLVAQVSGEIIKIADKFNKGEMIKKGDLLVQIDPFNYQVKLEQAKASLASARASYILERAQGQVAEAEWAQISKAEPSELGLRKPQQEQALAAVKAAEAGLKQAQKDLERTTLISPFSAIIQSRNVSIGSFVNTGSQIGQIMDTSVADIRLPINQQDFAFLSNRGLHAEVTLTSSVNGTEKTWPAEITRTEGMIDSNTRMMHVIASIKRPYKTVGAIESNALPFGSYVTATIKGINLAEAMAIPRHIIRNGKVPVVIDNKLLFKDVTVARHEGKNSIISDGLSNQDRIIISALDHPTNGMSVHWQSASDNSENQREPDDLGSR